MKVYASALGAEHHLIHSLEDMSQTKLMRLKSKDSPARFALLTASQSGKGFY
jgi:hypothetical protein